MVSPWWFVRKQFETSVKMVSGLPSIRSWLMVDLDRNLLRVRRKFGTELSTFRFQLTGIFVVS
jgi:hypothetical protein